MVFPFIVSGSSTIEVEAAANIFKADGEPLAKEMDGGITYKRQKPFQLYCDLIKVFCHDKSMHIIDACSGAGSCAMACSTLGHKVHCTGEVTTKAKINQTKIWLYLEIYFERILTPVFQKLIHTETHWVGDPNLLIAFSLQYFHSNRSLIFNFSP